MFNPKTLLPYGVERPRSLKNFLFEKWVEAKCNGENMAPADRRAAIRIALIPVPMPPSYYETYPNALPVYMPKGGFPKYKAQDKRKSYPA